MKMYNTQILATLVFIQEAHAGQKYGNMPYFYHPLEVADQLYHPTHAEYMAALMHDVIEDTDYTAADLLERYSQEVVDMVVLLTKDDTLDYKANIQRIIDSGNTGAMKAKLADNAVNLRGDKSQMNPARAAKLTARYKMSMEMLEAALDELIEDY